MSWRKDHRKDGGTVDSPPPRNWSRRPEKPTKRQILNVGKKGKTLKLTPQNFPSDCKKANSVSNGKPGANPLLSTYGTLPGRGPAAILWAGADWSHLTSPGRPAEACTKLLCSRAAAAAARSAAWRAWLRQPTLAERRRGVPETLGVPSGKLDSCLKGKGRFLKLFYQDSCSRLHNLGGKVEHFQQMTHHVVLPRQPLVRNVSQHVVLERGQKSARTLIKNCKIW